MLQFVAEFSQYRKRLKTEGTTLAGLISVHVINKVIFKQLTVHFQIIFSLSLPKY